MAEGGGGRGGAIQNRKWAKTVWPLSAVGESINYLVLLLAKWLWTNLCEKCPYPYNVCVCNVNDWSGCIHALPIAANTLSSGFQSGNGKANAVEYLI